MPSPIETNATTVNGAAPSLDLDRKAAATLFVVATLLLVFIMAARTPLDTDMWWHLRVGEETLRSGQPLLSDPFSFTRQGAHWINHSWLSQVGMALLYRWGGFLALGGLVALLAVISMGLVYRQCVGPAPLKAIAILLGSVVASTVWTIRPQLASLVLAALVSYLLYLYKWRGRKNILWALPPIFVLWSNLHGGYVIGLLLIGAMLGGETLNHLLGIETNRVPWRGILRLGLVGLLCGAAALLNPNGLDTWRIPFQTVNVGVLQQYIPEWASPDFHEPLQQSLLWLLLAVFVASALSGRRMDGTDLLTTLGFAFMALLARRNYGPFALVAVPVLTRCAQAAFETGRSSAAWPEMLNRFRPRQVTQKPGGRGVKKVINLSLIALMGLVAFGKLYTVTYPALVGHYLEQSYPSGAVRWLAENRPSARVFNEYDWGGYLEWSLPDARVFVDGRTDLFGDQVIGAWIAAIQGDPGWQVTLQNNGVDLVLIRPERPLAGLLRDAGWQVLYQDTQAVLYGHP